MHGEEKRILMAWGYSYQQAKSMCNAPDFNKPVFRFQKEEQHIESFCAGNIYLSTLSRCREYEDAEQGDKNEGRMTFSLPEINTRENITTSTIYPIHGVKFEDCDGGTSVGNFASIEHKNAFILCTTNTYNPDLFNSSFGKYCARIDNPIRFLWHVSEVMKDMFKINVAAGKKITYRSRDITNERKNFLDMCFIKPTVPYLWQDEFRLLWDVVGNIEPQVFYVPDVVKYIKRVA